MTHGIGGSTGATDEAILRADGVGGATLQGSGVTISDANAITAGAGTVSLPAYTFAGDTDTGFYLSGSNTVTFTTNNSARTAFSSGIQTTGQIIIGAIGSTAGEIGRASCRERV